jgi:hypothetical protein
MREIDTLAREYAAEIIPVTVAQLPAVAIAGQRRFASNGRKAGEGAAAGTGVPVHFDGTAWRTPAGATVAA